MPNPLDWLARNVAGPMQQALTGEVPGFIARPLAGLTRQTIVPGGKTGASAASGLAPPTASALESFQEDRYPAADIARGRLLRSYEPGGANRRAWVDNAMSSNPESSRSLIEGAYDSQVFPGVARGLRSPSIPGERGAGPSSEAYFDSGPRAVVVKPNILPSLTSPNRLAGHEYAHAAERGSRRSRPQAAPTDEALWEHRLARASWENDQRTQGEPWFQEDVSEGRKVWPRARPVDPWEGVPSDLAGDVRGLDEELWSELFGEYEQGGVPWTPGAHAKSRVEQQGNVHAIRALLQEQRGSGLVLPHDVRKLMERGFFAGEEYGGGEGAGDLGWMLKHLLKVDPGRAADILNLLSERTPQPKGPNERALTGAPGSLSSALGQEYEKVVG